MEGLLGRLTIPSQVLVFEDAVINIGCLGLCSILEVLRVKYTFINPTYDLKGNEIETTEREGLSNLRVLVRCRVKVIKPTELAKNKWSWTEGYITSKDISFPVANNLTDEELDKFIKDETDENEVPNSEILSGSGAIPGQEGTIR